MLLLAVFLFGLIFGSFLNVCIHRWPKEEGEGRNVAFPGSHCPKCERPIRWYDNIPVLSFALLRGRCRSCRESISWRYPVVELANAGVWVALVAKYGWEPFTWKALLFASMMLVLVVTDFEHYILPDEVTLGGLVVGLLLSLILAMPQGPVGFFWALTGAPPSARWVSLAESAAGAGFFGGLLWALREGYYRLRGVDGLGLGDVKMAAMMGAFWGLGQTLMILIVGSIGGAVIGTLIVLLGGRKWNHELPFGSYLGLAGLAVVYWGDEIFGVYWRTLGMGA